MMELKETFSRVSDILHLSERATKVLEQAFDQKSIEKDSFRDWYQQQATFVRMLVQALILLSLLNISSFGIRHLSSNPHLLDLFTIDHMRELLSGIECLLLIIIAFNIILFPNFGPKKIDNSVISAAYDASGHFLGLWPYLWFSWFGLYLIVTLVGLGVISENNVSPFLTACNNASGVIIFSMYYEMAERTETGRRGQLFIPTGMVLIALLALELILVKQMPDRAKDISLVFSFASGILIGVATGLLVTKLSSRIISLPLWATAFLIVYAVIQPVFPIIPIIPGSKEEFWKAGALSMTMIALYAKVLLLAVVHWMRDSGGLVRYMARARILYDEETDPRFREAFRIAISAASTPDYKAEGA